MSLSKYKFVHRLESAVRARAALPNEHWNARLAVLKSDTEEDAPRPTSPHTPPLLFGETGDQGEFVRISDAPGTPDTLDLTRTLPPLELTPTTLPAATTIPSTATPSTSRAPPLISLAHQRRIK